MRPPVLLLILVAPLLLLGSVFYLLKNLRQQRQLVALVGIFCLAMGFLLLVLDLVLITFTHGFRTIPDYLLFNRLVADSGFAGRWVLTVYVFFSGGIAITIYLLAMDMIKKLNKHTSGDKH